MLLETLFGFSDRQFRHRVLELCLHQYGEIPTIVAAFGQRGKSFVISDVIEAIGPAHAFEFRLVQSHRCAPAVGIRTNGAAAADRRPIFVRVLQDYVRSDIRPDERHSHIEHGQLDMLAASALAAREERRGNRLMPGPCGQLVEQQHVDLLGHIGVLPMNAALDRRDAGVRLDDGIVGAVAGPRAGLTEAADGQIDQPRVVTAEALVVDAQPIDNSRPEILDHHVAIGSESLDDVDPVGLTHIQADRPLASIQNVEEAGIAVAFGTHSPLDIAAGPLHLDDLSTLIREQRAGQWP